MASGILENVDFREKNAIYDRTALLDVKTFNAQKALSL